MSCGKINELGWLRSWESQGFDDNKCISELIGNSIDAKAKNIKFINTINANDNKIYICDDGIGMNKQEFMDMYDVYNNKKIENRIGNFGFGTKPAQLNLSRKTYTKIITKKEDNTFYTAYIDWDYIYKQGT